MVSSFLAVRTGSIDLCLDATRVLRVLPIEDWTGAPLAVLELLLEQPVQSKISTVERCHRVLLLRGPLGECPVGTNGKLVLRQCDSSARIPLSPLIWPLGATAMLTEVVDQPDHPPMAIVSIDALAMRLMCTRSEDSTAPGDHS